MPAGVGFGYGGPSRVGPPPFIAARDNVPHRVQGGGAEGQMLRTLNVRTWDDAPIPTATNFFLRETANLVLPAAAGATVTTTPAGGGALLIPPNNITSLQAVILFCDAPTLTTSILYTVRANQVPIPGLANLGFPPQASAFINLAIPGPWNVVQAGAFIDVLITRVVADVAKQVNFSIVGWFNSPQDVLRWTGQQPGQVG
jgi:hypothetical protein